MINTEMYDSPVFLVIEVPGPDFIQSGPYKIKLIDILSLYVAETGGDFVRCFSINQVEENILKFQKRIQAIYVLAESNNEFASILSLLEDSRISSQIKILFFDFEPTDEINKRLVNLGVPAILGFSKINLEFTDHFFKSFFSGIHIQEAFHQTRAWQRFVNPSIANDDNQPYLKINPDQFDEQFTWPVNYHRGLNGGNFLHNIPTNLQVGDTAVSKIRIGYNEIKEKLLTDLSEAEIPSAKIYSVKVSPVMVVHLNEYPETRLLEIIPLNSPEQFLEQDSFTEWQFDINAVKIGQTNLLLRLAAKLMIEDFGEKTKDVAVISQSLRVNQSNSTETKSLWQSSAIQPAFDSHYRQKCNDLISQGKVEEALARMVTYLGTQNLPLFQQVLVLQSQWNINMSEYLQGTISHEVIQLHRNRITKGAIELLNNITH